MERYCSWGRWPREPQLAVRIQRRDVPLPVMEGKLLPFGNGRSYGDVCLNTDGTLLDARELDRFIAFDPDGGTLRCEAGMLLSEILDLIVPQGWFLPVTPGTRFITLGGAIANDVHGKNHHKAGTFGCHVTAFELLRSDATRLNCTPHENGDWYRATIGGLGLTGLITWAEIRLQRIAGPWIDQQVIRYRDLAEFFALSRDSDREFDYTVAWVDCLAQGKKLGRGLFMRGNFASDQRPAQPLAGPRLRVPFDPPFSLVNGISLRLFNQLYYHKQWADRTEGRVPFAPFFYPLDGIGEWNRIYGPRGFLQYQCVLPPTHAEEGIGEILERISSSGSGSFLAILKWFGSMPSPGLLSFPQEGVTLALDFPNHGARTLALMDSLDEVTRQAGGAIYPAKDARMSPEMFECSFPQWRELLPFIDPAFSSSFWRRVTSEER